MTRRQTDLATIDLAQWPDAEVSALAKAERQTYDRREKAIRHYVSGAALTAIARDCGIGRGQFYHLLRRCLTMHADGRLFGFRGLLLHQRTHAYRRSTPVRLRKNEGRGGAAGAFGTLVEAYPMLLDWLRKQVREHAVQVRQLGTDGSLRIQLRGLGVLHSRFLTECRRLGLTAADYPFNTQQLGRRTLAVALKAEILCHFGRAARASGASHLKGRPRNDHGLVAPAPQHALDVVEFDGHRLDVRLKIVVRDPLGFEHRRSPSNTGNSQRPRAGAT